MGEPIYVNVRNPFDQQWVRLAAIEAVEDRRRGSVITLASGRRVRTYRVAHDVIRLMREANDEIVRREDPRG